MHRFVSPIVLTCVALLASPAVLRAQSADGQFTIIQVRLGFPAGAHSGDPDAEGIKEPIFKIGAWAPVQVDVKCDAVPADPARGLELVVETTDADDDGTSYPVALAPFQAGEQRTVMAYTKPGTDLPDVTVLVRDTTPRHRALSEPYNFTAMRGLNQEKYLYLTLGSRLPGFRLPGVTETASRSASTQRRSEMVSLLSVNELPTDRKGYDGIDLALLTTANTEFVTALQSNRRARAALIEWVRGGGRLVVSVGSNQALVAPIADLAKLLPVQFQAARKSPPAATAVWTDVSANSLREPLRATGTNWLATFTPKTDRPVRVLMSARFEHTEQPLAVQAPYGLGRVTFIGIDLDARPFSTWKDQPGFWGHFLLEAGPRISAATTTPTMIFRGPSSRYGPAEADDPLSHLQAHLEQFQDVPVIGFGWVALFIFLYILVVGPLDYLILKKFVKRLELTWITFPVVVLTVSAIAYFAAYSLKGNDLKVNKIDLVEIDLRGRETFGTSWFTVFSPRIQNYTVGIQPTAGWAGKAGDSPPVVSWLGQPKNTQRSLFRRNYEYTERAEALVNVPIPVWSTKSFVGQWRAPFDDAAPPLRADLRSDLTLSGGVTNLLTVDLRDAVLVYGDRVYRIGDMPSGVTRRVTSSESQFQSWLSRATQGRYSLWATLFQDKMGVSSYRQGPAALRELDQSWRLRPEFHNEAVLLARVADQAGPADPTNRAAGTPTRLWLGALPQAGSEPPPVAGTQRQETYVCVYLPVRAGRR